MDCASGLARRLQDETHGCLGLAENSAALGSEIAMTYSLDNFLSVDGLAVRRRLSDRYFDLALVLGLSLLYLVTGVLIAVFVSRDHGHYVLTLLGSGALILGDLSLIKRRSRPTFVLVCTLGAFFLAELVKGFSAPTFDAPIALIVAIYSYALLSVPQRLLKTALLVWFGVIVAMSIATPFSWGSLFGVVAIATLVVGVGSTTGLYAGIRREYVAQLIERAETLARERNLLADKAVAEERVRIARELHDIVSHHIALMVIEANAARATLTSQPTKSAEMIDQVADSGRSALNEMRRMLGVLRTADLDTAPLGPSPGIGEIRDLVHRTEEAGISIEYVLEGDSSSLTEQVQLSCYRIVQEALTNVIKYAPSSHTSVRVAISQTEIELAVLDDGPGEASKKRTGHGIAGMRERVAIFGGNLVAGNRIAGGFEVRASIPTKGQGQP